MLLTEKLITIPRTEFLENRRKQIADMHDMKTDEVIVVMDPFDDIACDVCNCNVETETVSLNDWGLYCDDCAVEYKVKRA